MAQPSNTKRRSCARASCSKIPTPPAAAVVGVHLRRSGGAHSGPRPVTGSVLTSGWPPPSPATFFIALGAARLNLYDYIHPDDESASGVLELSRAHCGHTFLLLLRQGASGPGTQRLFLDV